MDNLISMLWHDGPILGLIMTVIKDKIVVKWCDLRGALIFICNNESLLLVLTFFVGLFFGTPSILVGGNLPHRTMRYFECALYCEI